MMIHLSVLTSHGNCLLHTARMPSCVSAAQSGKCKNYLGRLVNLLAYGLPFIGLVLANGFFESSNLETVNTAIPCRIIRY
jgi:hypothetical protein